MFCSPFQFLFLKYIFCSPLQSPAWYKTICKMKVTLKGQTFQCWRQLHWQPVPQNICHPSVVLFSLLLLNSWWLWRFPKLFQWFLHLKLMTQMIWSMWVKNKNKQKTHKCFIAPCWSSSSRTKEKRGKLFSTAALSPEKWNSLVATLQSALVLLVLSMGERGGRF